MARFIHHRPHTQSSSRAIRFGVVAGILILFALVAGAVGLILQLVAGALLTGGGVFSPLALLHNPNTLFLLFIAAAICLYVELAHPGAVVPGVIGTAALVLFVVGALTLSFNWAGFVLMVLAILLLAVDVRAPTHGVLTLSGLASLIAGSLIFFDSGATAGGAIVSPFLIWSVAAGVGLVALVVIRYAIRSQHGHTTAGGEGLIGETAVALESLAPSGHVRVLGEIWYAELDELNASSGVQVAAGATVRVVARQGLKLIVEPQSYD